MAKNLYNLTAVTTVNDSDLLHVNQGGVSSDKKVTKQNLLKEVNSSITSLNNSLANIGSRNINIFEGHQISTTLAYTGVSFVIPKTSVVRADLYYNANAPREVAICMGTTGAQNVMAHTVAPTDITCFNISCTAILAPGTYYVWAKAYSAGQNNIGVYSAQLAP